MRVGAQEGEKMRIKKEIRKELGVAEKEKKSYSPHKGLEVFLEIKIIV